MPFSRKCNALFVRACRTLLIESCAWRSATSAGIGAAGGSSRPRRTARTVIRWDQTGCSSGLRSAIAAPAIRRGSVGHVRTSPTGHRSGRHAGFVPGPTNGDGARLGGNDYEAGGFEQWTPPSAKLSASGRADAALAASWIALPSSGPWPPTHIPAAEVAYATQPKCVVTVNTQSAAPPFLPHSDSAMLLAPRSVPDVPQPPEPVLGEYASATQSSA